MHFISSVEQIRECVWWRCIDYCGRNDVWHVSMIAIFGDPELGIGVELADCAEMNITTTQVSTSSASSGIYLNIPKDSNAHRLLGSNVLQLLDKPIPLILVVPCCPMIVKVIQNFNASIKMIQEIFAEKAGSAKCLNRVHEPRRKAVES